MESEARNGLREPELLVSHVVPLLVLLGTNPFFEKLENSLETSASPKEPIAGLVQPSTCSDRLSVEEDSNHLLKILTFQVFWQVR
jgi:hypothetical protein